MGWRPTTSLIRSRERRKERQRELASGVDADLVRANKRRTWLSWGLIALAIALYLLTSLFQMSGMPYRIMAGAAAVSLVTGGLLARWAAQEKAFLDKPDPEGPPSMFGKTKE
ncbi:MAG: hypothetical protein WBP79_05005 [Candidatus Acidiferrales bacterium]